VDEAGIDDDVVNTPGGSEPSDDSAQRRKKSKLETGSDAASRSDELDDGEIRESNPESEPLPAQAIDGGINGLPKKHAGWNQGVNNGLRISFGARKTPASRPAKPSVSIDPQATDKPEASVKTEPLADMETSVSTEPPVAAEHTVEIEPPVDPAATNGTESSISQDVQDLVKEWVRPTVLTNFAKRPRNGETWQRRFETWCERMIRANMDRPNVLEPAFLRSAWEQWLREQKNIPKSSRVGALKGSSVDDIEPGRLQTMLDRAQAGLPEEKQPEAPKTLSKKERKAMDDAAGDWVLPPARSSSDYDLKSKDEEGWMSAFADWCQQVIDLNPGRITPDTYQLRHRLETAYSGWVGTIDGLSKTKSSVARRAASVHMHRVLEGKASLFPDSVVAEPEVVSGQQTDGAGISDPSVPGPKSEQEDESPYEPAYDETESPEDGEYSPTSGNEETLPVEMDMERDAERRDLYYPGISPDEQFCTMCASRSHTSPYCPDLICQFCGDNQEHYHPSYACPTRRRCTKCKQLGHSKQECREKLALAPDEGEAAECTFCKSQDHTDSACSSLWRTFRPPPESECKKVKALPVYCSRCGNEGHYGPDCGLNFNPIQQKRVSGGTWSMENHSRYVDPESEAVAISLGPLPTGAVLDVGFTADGSPSLPTIPGKSIVPRRHEFFEEADDDDEEEFIKAPVQQKPQGKGRITFNTGGNGNHQQGNQTGGNYYSNNNNNNSYQGGGNGGYRSGNGGGRGGGNGGGGRGGRPSLPNKPPPPHRGGRNSQQNNSYNSNSQNQANGGGGNWKGGRPGTRNGLRSQDGGGGNSNGFGPGASKRGRGGFSNLRH